MLSRVRVSARREECDTSAGFWRVERRSISYWRDPSVREMEKKRGKRSSGKRRRREGIGGAAMGEWGVRLNRELWVYFVNVRARETLWG